MIGALLPADFSAAGEGFWLAARRGELAIQRCLDCLEWQHPPETLCVGCGSVRVDFMPVSGTGAIYSWTLVERALIPELRSHVPYTLALVDLAEGPRLLTLLVGSVSPRIGARVVVDFLEVEDVSLPVFRPADDA